MLVNLQSWSGDKSADLNVKKLRTGVNNAPFYLKSWGHAADDPEHILDINDQRDELRGDGDVRVEDLVQGGHKLVTDSSVLQQQENKPGYYDGATAIEDFKAAFLDQHLQWMLENHGLQSKKTKSTRLVLISIVQK